MNNENFMGLNTFLWFIGVDEDRNDPIKAGRVRVRIVGHHTENKTILPIWLLSIVLGIISYLIVMYYIAHPKFF